MFKNWKSTGAFLVFVWAYVYSLIHVLDHNIVDTAGYLALFSSIFMMFRSDITTEIVNKIIDVVGNKI